MFFVIPIGHDRGVFRIPWVTIALMAACVLVQIGMSLAPDPPIEVRRIELQAMRGRAPSEADLDLLEREAPYYRWGFVPARPHAENWLTHAFVHGGWLHVLGNLLFLWLSGAILEDRWGRGTFAGFYALGALAGAASFLVMHGAGREPIVGASGAVAAAMGAFLVTNWDARIRIGWVLFIFFLVRWGTFVIPAWAALPFWFAQQALGAYVESHVHVGVAFSAHVGGFLFGVAAALVLRLSGFETWFAARREEPGKVAFEEDPRFVRAMELPADAADEKRALLEDLLRDLPHHEGAQAELCRLALDGGDVAAAHAVLDRVISACVRRGAARDAVEIWSRATADGLPPPPDRAYLPAARAFEAIGEPREALATVGAMLRAHGESKLVPRALLEVARLQADVLGEKAAARKTLEALKAFAPGTAFADEAEARLRKL